MKIVVDDPIARMECREETEITTDTIRLEGKEKTFLVRFSEEAITINESTGKLIAVQPIAVNKIEIR